MDAYISEEKSEVTRTQLPIQKQPVTSQALFDENQSQLAEVQHQLQVCQNLLSAIESSKFWQLRQFWFDIKRKLNLPVNDTLYQDYADLLSRKSR